MDLFKALRGWLWDCPGEDGGDADVPADREVRPLPSEHEVHALPPLLPGPRGSQCIHQVECTEVLGLVQAVKYWLGTNITLAT